MADRLDDEAPAVMTEAAEWYWQMREPDVTDAQLREWQEWLAASPAHQDAFARIETALDGLAGIASPPWPTEEELLRDAYDGSVPVSRWLRTTGNRRAESPGTSAARPGAPPRYTLWLAAASVVVLAGIAAVLAGRIAPDAPTAEMVAYQTGPAEHRDVLLPDGSSVSLGGRTRIAIALGRASRRVDLQNGEAFFDVVADPSRPFSVVVDDRRILAVGTAFNVTRQASRVAVAVTEGEVLLENTAPAERALPGDAAGSPVADGRVARLMAGQRVVFDSDAIQPISFTSTEEALAWRTGILKYRGERLRYVIEDVNRYLHRPIQVADDAAGDLLYTGTVFQDEAEAWIDGLEDAFPVRIRQTANGAEILEQRQ